VDLKGYIFGQLVSMGILESHIVMDTGCTFNDESDFYSYRREAKKAGRMAAVIKLNEIG
jgi:copper oxidase (laccase) domain-containing protein